MQVSESVQVSHPNIYLNLPKEGTLDYAVFRVCSYLYKGYFTFVQLSDEARHVVVLIVHWQQLRGESGMVLNDEARASL